MYKLRLTWKDIYSQEDLYAMDVSVNALDPNWPITAVPPQPPPQPAPQPLKIHINPKFLKPVSKHMFFFHHACQLGAVN